MSDNSVSLHGKVVAITGAARGIGRATAQHLSRAGAQVAVGDLDGAEAEAAAASCGPQAIGAELDVRDPDSFSRFLDDAEEQLGPLDVLVNNAGIMPVGPLLDEPHAAARAMYEVNVLGLLSGVKLAGARMASREPGGRIVNVASYAGILPVPGQVSYAGTKAAVLAITAGARWELSDRGVAFTAVIPSFTNTDLIAGTGQVKTAEPIEPGEVAAAIVAAIRDEADEVYVPASVKRIGRLIGMLPRKTQRAIHRSLGTDRAFLEVDSGARASYSERISR